MPWNSFKILAIYKKNDKQRNADQQHSFIDCYRKITVDLHWERKPCFLARNFPLEKTVSFDCINSFPVKKGFSFSRTTVRLRFGIQLINMVRYFMWPYKHFKTIIVLTDSHLKGPHHFEGSILQKRNKSWLITRDLQTAYQGRAWNGRKTQAT